ncbi:hypothetical protein G6F57_003264 [Rhizopus arrhizus]|nr:hypothetical protein G6F30_003949 [Rhizopus arrhizus]KAG0985097.1 hypothetical protein G6F29_004276 [Rhizopus arrhizus]KAG0996757.1 hypothetical protein G6F28_003532 [Rhizopus arrhizus]KAG1010744.1 hypothetical protein G6F27_004369 [Rhizopus arrhizus]KAG1026460.1 hypothetical protein G6F26_004249 [Rhizopus arrhizus]
MVHSERTNHNSPSLSNGGHLSDVNNYSLPAQTKISWSDVVALGNLQQTLTPGSVIFSFPNNSFDKVTDAYKAIEHHLEEADAFCKLFKYETRCSAQFIVVARFRQAEDSRKALSVGFVYNNMTFKVTFWRIC